MTARPFLLEYYRLISDMQFAEHTGLITYWNLLIKINDELWQNTDE